MTLTELLQCNYCVEHREMPLKLQSVLVWFIESQATSNWSVWMCAAVYMLLCDCLICLHVLS